MRDTRPTYPCMRLLLLLALISTFGSVADAGSGLWTTGGPFSGSSIEALAVDPSTPAKIYSGTAGTLFSSTDAGATWVANTVPYPTSVSTLAIDWKSPSTIYAGGGRTVSKSVDAGATWATSELPGGPIAPRSLYALAIDPQDPFTLYTGGCAQYLEWSETLLFKSNDGGSNWNQSLTGLERYTCVRALAIDPTTTPSTLYAGTARHFWPERSSGVFKSIDSGGTWAAANIGLTNLDVEALAIDPSNPGTLFAGTHGGVFKSTDSGGTWVAANIGLTNLNVNALVVDPTTPGTLYAGTEAGVFRSTDSGGTWIGVNWGWSSPSVKSLALDPTGEMTLYAASSGLVWQSTSPTSAADLSLILSDTPDPVTGSTPLTFTLSVSNAGPDMASTVSVSQSLPSGMTFVGADGSGWTCFHLGGVVTCRRATLAPGVAPPITVRVTPDPVGAVLTSSAVVFAETLDPVDANNSATQTTTVNAPPVGLGTRTKTVLADAGAFRPDTDVTYTITLANSGTALQADNSGHELVDVLPARLTLLSASATSGTAVGDPTGNTVTWDGELPSGGSMTLTIHARITATAPPGSSIANQATAYYDFDGNGTNEATALTDDPASSGANDPTSFIVASPPANYYALEPCRLVDTRNASGPFGGPSLGPGVDRVFPIYGQCGVPPTARSVSVNLAVTGATTAGNLRLYPAGAALPPVSSVNFVAGQTRANNAAVLLNDLGELAVRFSQAEGMVHMILDVNGYFQ